MGTSERREREKQQRKKDIIDAAEKVFFSKGYELATMDDVAKEAELSKGTLYLYFKSKEELYFAIILRAMKVLHDEFEKTVIGAKNGLEKTYSKGMAYIRFSRNYPNYFNALLYYESLKIDLEKIKKEYNYQDDIRIAAFHESDKTTEKLAEYIQEGIEDGSIRDDIDPHKIAVFLWGASTGLLQLISQKGHCINKVHNVDMDEYMDYFMEFLGKCLQKQC